MKTKNQSESVAARSGELFNQGLCCAESVLQAVVESRGLQSELIPKIATGLCGGVSRSGNICGAVSGGVLAISLFTGRRDASESREENHRLVRTLLAEFEARFGSTNCERLIGCRLDTPEGQRLFHERNLREKCGEFTREAARLASRLIEQSAVVRDQQRR
jgi:C_GCAxxG_C_C family probable redox protein